MPGICTSRAGKRTRPGDALDLHDDDAARVLDRHRLGEIVDGQRLALHRDVAGLVRRGAAQKRDGQGCAG